MYVTLRAKGPRSSTAFYARVHVACSAGISTQKVSMTCVLAIACLTYPECHMFIFECRERTCPGKECTSISRTMIVIRRRHKDTV